MIKWYPYLLEPFVMYGNSTAPLLRPLTKPELFIIISNIAIGNSMIPGQKVEIKDQMNAVQKLIDAYALIPQTQEHLNEEDLYKNLSVKELKNMARLLESSELQQKLAADKKKSKTKTTKAKTTKTTKTTKKKTTKKKEE
jgi:topoisomerase IA-like protein